jgi:hypothetical protein
MTVSMVIRLLGGRALGLFFLGPRPRCRPLHTLPGDGTNGRRCRPVPLTDKERNGRGRQSGEQEGVGSHHHLANAVKHR